MPSGFRSYLVITVLAAGTAVLVSLFLFERKLAGWEFAGLFLGGMLALMAVWGACLEVMSRRGCRRATSDVASTEGQKDAS